MFKFRKLLKINDIKNKNDNNFILKIDDIEFFDLVYKNLINSSIINIEHYIFYRDIYIFVNKFKIFINFKNKNKN